METALTLPEVAARLQRLESAVQSLGIPLDTDASNGSLMYIIYVDGEEAWRGQEVAEKYVALRRQHPNADVAIRWHAEPFVLV